MTFMTHFKLSNFGPTPLRQHCQRKPYTPPSSPHNFLLDDFYDKFEIIKICFSIMIRNIFWAIEAVFKDIRA